MRFDRWMAVALASSLALVAACAHKPAVAGPRPGAKPVAKIEFDSSSGDIYYVPAMIPSGYSRLEATWRGRELFVIARPAQGKRRVFWKMIPPYVNFQVRNQMGTQYFGAGKRTISIAVLDDGSEVALVAVAGSRRAVPRADSPLGKFFAEQVKDAMSGGGQDRPLPDDVKEHETPATPPAAAATPVPAATPMPGTGPVTAPVNEPPLPTPDEHPLSPDATPAPTP